MVLELVYSVESCCRSFVGYAGIRVPSDPEFGRSKRGFGVSPQNYGDPTLPIRTLLSNLVSLDLSLNDVPGGRLELQKPSFENLVEKLSNLKTLDLGDVSIDSMIPHSIGNLSSLTKNSISLGNLSKLLHLDLSLNEL
ncbi:hypothetical protein CUMW_155090 [Citrus unshiu]|uniref:Uncharacterized protein n=1 Tax=Citrus unshiu TaxID=55188 RepID=A0A2H5PPE2_CITUN|nr:hypothetical protein CUMW_155090 [Citrus unshiu]